MIDSNIQENNDFPTSDTFSLDEIFSGFTYNVKLTLTSYREWDLWSIELAEQFFEDALDSIQKDSNDTYIAKYPCFIGQLTLNSHRDENGITIRNIVGGHQEIMTTILLFKVVADLAAVYNKPGIRNDVMSVISMFDQNDKRIPRINLEKQLDQEDLDIIINFMPHSTKEITPKTIQELAKNMGGKIDIESPFLKNYYKFLQIMHQAITTGSKGQVYPIEYLLHTVFNIRLGILNLPEGVPPTLPVF